MIEKGLLVRSACVAAIAVAGFSVSHAQQTVGPVSATPTPASTAAGTARPRRAEARTARGAAAPPPDRADGPNGHRLHASGDHISENFLSLFRQTPEMVVITSGPEHRFEFVNEALVRVLGFDATEHPVALQLGGSDRGKLADATQTALSLLYEGEEGSAHAGVSRALQALQTVGSHEREEQTPRHEREPTPIHSNRPAAYPKVKQYASAPGSRNVISTVRSVIEPGQRLP